MRGISIWLLLLCPVAVFSQCGPADTTDIFEVYMLDKQPEFPGGQSQLLKFISQAPLPPLDSTIEIAGRFAVSFLIEKDGSVSSICPLIHADHPWTIALIKHLTTMPVWTPGEMGGLPVRVRYRLPINICIRE